MLKRALVAAIAAACLMIPVAGCTNGQLTDSARTKLETASKWAHRVSAGAKLVIVGISTSCEGKTTKFCTAAMPFVLLADGALGLFNNALATADAALADPGTPEEKLANAAGNLIQLEKSLEDYIDKINQQKAEAPADVQALLAQMPGDPGSAGVEGYGDI